ISDEFLKEKYSLSKEYCEAYPEDSVLVLELVRSTEELIQAERESSQADEKLFKSIKRVIESTRELHVQMREMMQSERETMQSLRRLAQSSAELRAMTSNIENVVSICANRIFNPIKNGLRNGFRLLTGYREPPAILPREDLLAIEWYPEEAISHTDPINQPSIGKKNLSPCTQILWSCRRTLFFICKGTKDLVIYTYRFSLKWLSNISLWFHLK
ncbi:MAG: hypothetical protein LBC45_06505, partial [Chlamydiales bacterium]|nr:hypothetical protein [Chlamydiales bacterium]